MFVIDLRVKLAKSRARCDRWIEEAVLTTEEMRRNIAFGCWQRQQWLSLAESQSTGDDVLDEGWSVYALEQAEYETRLLEALSAKWTPIVRKWSSSQLLGAQLIKPFGVSSPSPTSGSGVAPPPHPPSSTITNAATVLLDIQASTGLALSTNDLEYEPMYVLGLTGCMHTLIQFYRW
jgi:hypothetical protein